MDVDRLGATHLGDGDTAFVVWAPNAHRVEVVFDDDRIVPMDAGDHGYHRVVVEGAGPGTRYHYRLHRPDAEPVDRPDPASRWQPDGLHGASAVDDSRFSWDDAAWRNPSLRDHVIYELHVGTFTPKGTFDAAAERLTELRDVGVTAIELMPIWQFPGERNWGYDGVLPYAVQNSYGGPSGLRRLVDAAHGAGIGVILDVVYNHFGPEGNHLPDFGPYLTDKYATPWGQAINVDDHHSDEVRRYIIENAVRWVTDFHLDGLRLDAVHAIRDESATHLLEELATAVHDEADRLGRRVLVIAESDLQDPRLVRRPELGGYGLDGQWLDDVHHAVHVAVTGEQGGYYQDYAGVTDLARAVRDRYVMGGRYSPYRGRTVGRPAPDVPYERFVACIQNHDQVGNRMLGDRLSTLVDLERQKLAAATLLLLPFTPMLWMGEEYGETAPFPYFVSHTDPDLVEAVRTGRREEFAAFAWEQEPPDPFAQATFDSAILDWSLRDKDQHAMLLRLHTELIRLRTTVDAIAGRGAGDVDAQVHGPSTISLRRSAPGSDAVTVINAGDDPADVSLPLRGEWKVLLDTADARWDGPGGAEGELVASDVLADLELRGWSVRLLVRA